MNEDIKAFLCNEENAYNCAFCPYNEGFDNWQGRYPCGQYHCWVEVYCREDEEEE